MVHYQQIHIQQQLAETMGSLFVVAATLGILLAVRD